MQKASWPAKYSYRLNGFVHDIADNGDFMVLVKTHDPANGLLFDSWVPLRLQEVYSIRNGKTVQS